MESERLVIRGDGMVIAKFVPAEQEEPMNKQQFEEAIQKSQEEETYRRHAIPEYPNWMMTEKEENHFRQLLGDTKSYKWKVGDIVWGNDRGGPFVIEKLPTEGYDRYTCRHYTTGVPYHLYESYLSGRRYGHTTDVPNYYGHPDEDGKDAPTPKLKSAYENFKDTIIAESSRPDVPHYQSTNIECIDYLKANMPLEAYQGFLEGNVKKYLHRWRYKGQGKADLEKARVYLGWLIDEQGESE